MTSFAFYKKEINENESIVASKAYFSRENLRIRKLSCSKTNFYIYILHILGLLYTF